MSSDPNEMMAMKLAKSANLNITGAQLSQYVNNNFSEMNESSL